MPFLWSTGGGLHKRLMEVEDGEEPVELTGAAVGPIGRESGTCTNMYIAWLTIFIKLHCKNCGVWPYCNCLCSQ